MGRGRFAKAETGLRIDRHGVWTESVKAESGKRKPLSTNNHQFSAFCFQLSDLMPLISTFPGP